MDVNVQSRKFVRRAGSAQRAANDADVVIAARPRLPTQLGGSGKPRNMISATMPSGTEQKNSGRQPYEGRIREADSAAMTYPTDHPACRTPSTVVRIRVGTYSAASSVPML